jgi:hypothetical protein
MPSPKQMPATISTRRDKLPRPPACTGSVAPLYQNSGQPHTAAAPGGPNRRAARPNNVTCSPDRARVVTSSPDRYRAAIDRVRRPAYNRLSSRAPLLGNRKCAVRTSLKQIANKRKRRVGGPPKTAEFAPAAKRIGRYWALAQYFDPGGSARIVRGLLLPPVPAADSYPGVNIPQQQMPRAGAIVKMSDPARRRATLCDGCGPERHPPSPVPGFVAWRMVAPSWRPKRVGNSEATR